MNTSLVIDKDTHLIAKNRAKKDKLSVSAVARFLLKAYGEGRINISAQAVNYSGVQLEEIQEIDLSAKTKKIAKEVYNTDSDKFVNI
jgi:hypothetical protein